jgi:hypothetical protein
MWKGAKKVCLMPSKMRQVKVAKECNFCNWLSAAVCDSIVDSKLNILY